MVRGFGLHAFRLAGVNDVHLQERIVLRRPEMVRAFRNLDAKAKPPNSSKSTTPS